MICWILSRLTLSLFCWVESQSRYSQNHKISIRISNIVANWPFLKSLSTGTPAKLSLMHTKKSKWEFQLYLVTMHTCVTLCNQLVPRSKAIRKQWAIRSAAGETLPVGTQNDNGTWLICIILKQSMPILYVVCFACISTHLLKGAGTVKFVRIVQTMISTIAS